MSYIFSRIFYICRVAESCFRFWTDFGNIFYFVDFCRTFHLGEENFDVIHYFVGSSGMNLCCMSDCIVGGKLLSMVFQCCCLCKTFCLGGPGLMSYVCGKIVYLVMIVDGLFSFECRLGIC